MGDARQDQIRQAAPVVEKGERRDAREVRLDADVLRVHGLTAEVAAAHVEADRQLGRLGRCPDRIPVRVAQRRLAVVLRLVAEEQGGSRGGAALDLAHRRGHVPERRRHHGHEPARIGAGPLEQPVVVGAHAGEHELRVADAQEAARPEAAHVRVEHVRVQLLLVHEGEARLGVVHGRRDVVVGLAHVRERAGVAGRGVRAGHATGRSPMNQRSLPFCPRAAPGRPLTATRLVQTSAGSVTWVSMSTTR
jgi:hypothetical protein